MGAQQRVEPAPHCALFASCSVPLVYNRAKDTLTQQTLRQQLAFVYNGNILGKVQGEHVELYTFGLKDMWGRGISPRATLQSQEDRLGYLQCHPWVFPPLVSLLFQGVWLVVASLLWMRNVQGCCCAQPGTLKLACHTYALHCDC
jgi:hypothetical protein